MAVLFTRGKQNTKRAGVFIFEKLNFPRFFFFLKNYENNGTYYF